MIVFRYLIREVLKAQIAVLFVLLTIFISQHFVRILADASDGEFPASLIATLIGLNLPYLVVLVLPLSLFLGILMAHGRMYAENEMVILHGVGVSEWYVTRVTLILAVINMLFTGYLSLYVAPWAEEQQNQVLEKAQSEAGLAALVQGRFQASPNGRAVLFVERIGKDNDLDKVFVAQLPDPNDEIGLTNVVVAKGGRVLEDQNGSQQLQLNDGVRYQGSPQQKDYQMIEFGGYKMQIKEQQVDERRRKLSALPLTELMKVEGPEAVAEFHWRLAIPLAIPIMTLIAVPLARVNVRQGKFAKMLPAVLLYLGYFGLMVAGRKALQDGVIPQYLGMWWIHLSALIMGILLLGKDRPLFARLSTAMARKKVAA
ncbi:MULTISPECIES: LPS export ABC transporter permease LptF [Shewanella]|uniref:Lipopolysaccharide export system permease protein LptF n=3 Tax=Shewanella TaxID=22 RepID=A0A220UJR7_9GAMM|nr:MULTISPECIES: LPS export ABC transporter permease LptF [Shewanella]MCL1120631.1 LPS export ABC transporter permease LptF [Shewanella seohaensis]VEE60926.1 Lipopolysaccharide export system permease protein lptF [Shewanella putrefaciens]ABI39897.1 permease YjgP/YjgQ family protein [Shewanella sp. MR-4]ABK49230.1 permease YjgP/YjgQ family protein [Shewanella sp. ANA-3]ASK68428.1 LPS export ABC transporter permease LptF [Shewanella bicestrii]